MTKSYTLWVALPARLPLPDDLLWLNPPMRCPAVLTADLDLETARSGLRALRSAKGNGPVLPGRYARPRVSEEQATHIASAEYHRLEEAVSDRFGPLGPPEDDGAWWAFWVENLSAQDRGVMPGARTIAVDKVSGALLTREETDEILSLSVSS